MVWASLLILAFSGLAIAQTITRVPSGFLHVRGPRLLDSEAKPVLLRGTQVSGLAFDSSDFAVSSDHRFGALSATTFNAIRERWNMNVVRLPVDATRYMRDPLYPARLEEAVGNANRQELLVILAAHEPGTDLPSERMIGFWRECAHRFNKNTRILFDVYSAPKASGIPGHVPGRPSDSDWRFWLRGGYSIDGRKIVGVQQMVDAVRATGASQPILVTGLDDAPLLRGLTPEFLVADPGIVYETTPRFRDLRAEALHDNHFEFLADRVPILVNGWDLGLDKREECRAIPKDPDTVEHLVEADLDYFDERNISWTVSSFTPGKLITDYRYFYTTKLDNGLPCGSYAGMGMVVQFHLFGSALRGLVTVTCSNAMFVLARGGIAQSYGPVLSDREGDGHGTLPTKLENISVRITDSHGAARLAPLLHVGGGWSFVNFIVPAQTTTGPAEVAVVRTDGSTAVSRVVIDDLSPALLTGAGDGRGAVVGEATQTPGRARTSESELLGWRPRQAPSSPVRSHTFASYRCGSTGCATVPIPLAYGVSTTVRLLGTGFRNAGSIHDIRVEVGGIAVPILSFGPSSDPGVDQVTLSLPPAFRSLGETDLMLSVGQRHANVVRINCGSI